MNLRIPVLVRLVGQVFYFFAASARPVENANKGWGKVRSDITFGGVNFDSIDDRWHHQLYDLPARV